MGSEPKSTTHEVVKSKVSTRQLRAASASVRAADPAQPSRGEELGRALSVAVLCYGIPIGVLVLHALWAKGKRRAA